MNNPPSSTRRRRSTLVRVVAAVIAIVLAAAGAAAWSALSVTSGALAISASTGEAPEVGRVGSVAGSPGLPAGFADTFKDRFVHANGIRQHVVIGGEGPPLLLVHGWPENWYAWRYVMPELAEEVHGHRGRPTGDRAHREGPDRVRHHDPGPTTWPRS